MRRYLAILCLLTAPAAGQNKPVPIPLPLASATNIELTVYLVAASSNQQSPSQEDAPPDVAATLQQLRNLFTYKSYHLVDTIVLRGRNFGSSETAGNMPDSLHYEFRYARARVDGAAPRTVHIDGLFLEVRHRALDNDSIVGTVSTDLDLKEGQRTVVGKSTVNGSDALFLVIVPKVL